MIKLGIIFGLTSVILVMLLAQPRIFCAMAHDGLLPIGLAGELVSIGTRRHSRLAH